MLAAAVSTLALLHAGGAIKTYDGWTAWQDVDPQTQEYVVKVRSPNGKVTTRPERATLEDELNPEPTGLPFDLGPDDHGRPSIVLGTCGRVGKLRCRLAIARLPDRAARPIGGTRQREMPAAVTFWRQTVAWSDIDRHLHLRRRPGVAARVVHPWPQPSADVEEAELHGDLLAGTLNYSDRTAPEDNAVAIALANLETGHQETFATFQPGEGGQRFVGPSFVGGHALSWDLTCLGDPSGCNRRMGVYRRDLRTARTVFARDARPHFGFAAPDTATAFLGPDQANCITDDADAFPLCRIERKRLAFVPAPR